MKKKYFIILTYLILLFNTNLSSDEENKILKIGLIAPLTGEFAELGNSLLYSSQLALDEIGDKNVFIELSDIINEKVNFILLERITSLFAGKKSEKLKSITISVNIKEINCEPFIPFFIYKPKSHIVPNVFLFPEYLFFP